MKWPLKVARLSGGWGILWILDYYPRLIDYHFRSHVHFANLRVSYLTPISLSCTSLMAASVAFEGDQRQYTPDGVVPLRRLTLSSSRIRVMTEAASDLA